MEVILFVVAKVILCTFYLYEVEHDTIDHNTCRVESEQEIRTRRKIDNNCMQRANLTSTSKKLMEVSGKMTLNG